MKSNPKKERAHVLNMRWDDNDQKGLNTRGK